MGVPGLESDHQERETSQRRCRVEPQRRTQQVRLPGDSLSSEASWSGCEPQEGREDMAAVREEDAR